MAFGAGGIGWLAGTWIHVSVGVAVGSVAAVNGAVCGWRGTYAWRRPSGWVAALLDSTWASLPVAGGLIAHLVAALRRCPAERSLGLRQNRHVYRDGLALKRGFAFTMGNVISGAGDVDRPRRRRLVTDHEDVHVWQSRWFGPLDPLLYGVWAGGAAAAGCVLWLVRGRRERLSHVVESLAYYTNPFEWWAYSRDDLWPPPGKLAGLGWRRSVVRPLAATARRRRPHDHPDHLDHDR